MKINYVAALNPFKYHGGGEVVLQQLIETGRNRGHEIKITSLYPKKADIFLNPDLTILADIFNEPLRYRHFPNSFLKQVIETKKYVHFDNAYVDCCNLDYLPCSGNKDKACKHKSFRNIKRNIRSRDFSKWCFQENNLIQNLYGNSVLNIFVSPLHQQIINKMLRLDDTKAYVLKPLVDGNTFYNMYKKRDIEYLFIGAIGEAKGINNMRERFSTEKIYLIGNLVKGTKLDFGSWLRFLPYQEIPHYLNRTKNFVFLPRWPEPQGRVVIEAALCGCNLITNENVGATSFPFDISSYNNFKNAGQEFWEGIEIL
jgi:glycosyltransferase involved in cell wall biosynthesis